MKYLNYLIIFLIVFGLFTIGGVKASVSDNVTGWAWSENIGWISFNCYNDYDGDGTPEGRCIADGYASDYGVDIDKPTGLFSGYAWSENIGWISFGDYDGDGDIDADDKNIAGSPCAPNCEARISTTTGEVSGWARALAYGDGWDGWIKLKGIALDASPYGVSLNTASSPSEFEGWAFGGDDTDEEAVIGWISWNHLNCDANNDGFSDGTGACPPAGTSISDYKVTTSVSFVLPNQPPTVTDMNDPDNSQIHCGIAPGITHINFEWKYNDADGDNELKYNLIVNDVNNVNDPNPEINTTINNPSCSDLDPGPAISCNNTSGANVGVDLEYHKTYYWWVRVYDNQGNDSGWVAGPSFNTPDHPWPWPDFTHSPSEPNTKEIVTFTDNSQCWTTGSSVSVPCKNLGVTNYEWDFDYIVAEGFTPNSTVKGDATTSYPSSGSYEVRLRIKDDLGTCTGSGDSPVGVKKPLPEWKEAPPITWIRQFLATIFDLLNF